MKAKKSYLVFFHSLGFIIPEKGSTMAFYGIKNCLCYSSYGEIISYNIILTFEFKFINSN